MKQFRTIVLPLLFFLSFFLFLLFYINPIVLYSNNGSTIHPYVVAIHSQQNASQSVTTYADSWYRNIFILELTGEYLQGIVTTPGGWSRLLVTLCIYACYFPLLGAFILTGTGFLLYCFFSSYLRNMRIRSFFVIAIVPVFFIMIMCSWYELRYLMFILPVITALFLTLIYQRIRPAQGIYRVLLTTVLFWLAWYGSQWGELCTLLFILLHEWRIAKRGIVPALVTALVNIMLCYYLETMVIPMNQMIRWSSLHDFLPLSVVIIGYYPVATTLSAVIARLQPSGISSRRRIAVYSILTLFSIMGGFAWVVQSRVHRDCRTIARTVYNVKYGNWEKILQENTSALFSDFPETAGQLQLFMIHAVDYALCRTGTIGDKLFTFPQASFSDDPLLMLHSTSFSGLVNWMVVLEVTMDLGMLNSAEKIAGELMEVMGPYPDILYRRALIQIAKGNKEPATIYLNKLTQHPYYRKKARKLVRSLQTNDSVLSEPRIAAMYSNKNSVDYYMFNNENIFSIFVNLMQSNSNNRLAFDYLVSYCLLYGMLDEVAAILQNASSVGYTTLPRYWEEALYLRHTVKSIQTGTEISNSGFRQTTVNQFTAFTQDWLKIQNEPDADDRLAPKYGDTYFYFSVFHHTCGVKK